MRIILMSLDKNQENENKRINLNSIEKTDNLTIVKAANPILEPRKPGALKGKGSVPDSFFDPIWKN